ncbi:leucine rich repeat domain-containing protein [Phthorimaea operculella]|nr:leucine rich repeat domain-containing protein [Phthorimaea operculella]
MILSRKSVASTAALVALWVVVVLASVDAEASEPCSVQKDEVIKITNLNCKDQGLDSIPDYTDLAQSIDKDAHVRVTFFNNNITNITELPSIPGFQVALIFTNNKIREILPGAFSRVTNLLYLDLRNNSLTGDVLRSEIFQGPYNGDGTYKNIPLERLYLSNNKIHSLDRYLFQYTPNLTQLFLNNNPIEKIDYVTAYALSSATNLQLQELDLSGNQFVTVPESLKLVGTTLKSLTFNNNPIVELSDDSFVGLTSLTALEVGDNDYLVEVQRSTFSPLRSLKILHLCHNRKLRYISHNAFRGMKDKWTIREVYIEDNNLSELSTDLMPWGKLEKLDMTGNSWLCNCDLANIVVTQGAGQKFKEDHIPLCSAPMKMHGEYLTNITSYLFCPTFDSTTSKSRNGFSLTDLKPRHVLWSVVGVGLIVVIGMLLGLLVNAAKAFYNKKFNAQPIHYINLRTDSSFA